MDVEKLKQYRDMSREVKHLEERIGELRSRDCTGVDMVRGSSRAFPYGEHSLKVKGYDKQYAARLNRMVTRLEKRRTEMLEQLEEMDLLIAAISDSEVRQIVELRYIKDLPWNVVAYRLYGYPNGDRARKRAKRFLRKI